MTLMTHVRVRMCLAMLAAIVCGACERAAGSIQKPILRFGTGTALGRDFVEDFSRHLPGLELRVVATGGSVGTLDAMRRGQVDLGIVTADVAYFAERTSLDDADTRRHVRGISVTSVAPLHLVVRPGLLVDSIGDLRGRLVGIGPQTAGSNSVTNLVMNTLRIAPRLVQRPSSVVVDRPTELFDVATGALDAAVVVGYDPMPEVAQALGAGARLASIEGMEIENLRQHYPFIRLVSIPAHTYPTQETVLHTLGVDTVLVCVDEVDEEIVSDLTEAFFVTLPDHMSKKPWSGRYLDWDRVSATTIPLHTGAARYYRERELSR